MGLEPGLSNVGVQGISLLAQPRTYAGLLRLVGAPTWLPQALATTGNWQDLVALQLGAKKKVDVVFRDGSTMRGITRDRMGEYFVMRHAKYACPYPIRFDGKKAEFVFLGRKVVLYGPEAVYSASDMFFSRAYSALHCKGKVVFDVGANIGDSAVYFALSGARHVYSFEPYPSACKTARENISRNRVSSKVTLFSMGIAGKEGCVRIGGAQECLGGSQAGDFGGGRKVRMIGIQRMLGMCRHSGPKALKIDCEGCEYDALLGAPDSALRNFGEIMVEYHYGKRNLESRLRQAGFSVTETEPLSYVFNPYARNHSMFVGTIHAVRQAQR